MQRQLIWWALMGMLVGVSGCATMIDADRELIADQAVTRYLDSVDNPAAAKPKILAITAQVEALAVPGITGNALNAGLDLIIARLDVSSADVDLAKYIIRRFGVSVPELSLPVTDEHLRIIGVYVAEVRKAVAEFP